mmetsp:Transcript_23691/g.52648  ORF Transcript_23691/g.52648 Transcript_23691/m.52648 type:complete len:260 (-) Transcript_23691:165-944(-)
MQHHVGLAGVASRHRESQGQLARAIGISAHLHVAALEGGRRKGGGSAIGDLTGALLHKGVKRRLGDAAARHHQIASHEVGGAVLEHAGHRQLGQAGCEQGASQGRGLTVGGLLDQLVQLGGVVCGELAVVQLRSGLVLLVHVGGVGGRCYCGHHHRHSSLHLIGKDGHVVHDLLLVRVGAEGGTDALHEANHLQATSLTGAHECGLGQEVGGSLLASLLGAAASLDAELEGDHLRIDIASNCLHAAAELARRDDGGSRR